MTGSAATRGTAHGGMRGGDDGAGSTKARQGREAIDAPQVGC
jgi:hypothetical protein